MCTQLMIMYVYVKCIDLVFKSIIVPKRAKVTNKSNFTKTKL